MTPCPFCAGTKFHYNTKAKGYFVKKQAEREGRDTSNHLVRCTKCGAKGPLRSTEADAVAAWNERIGRPEAMDALAFYADPTNWSVGGEFLPASPESEFRPDAGDTARAALAAQPKEINP